MELFFLILTEIAFDNGKIMKDEMAVEIMDIFPTRQECQPSLLKWYTETSDYEVMKDKNNNIFVMRYALPHNVQKVECKVEHFHPDYIDKFSKFIKTD